MNRSSLIESWEQGANFGGAGEPVQLQSRKLPSFSHLICSMDSRHPCAGLEGRSKR